MDHNIRNNLSDRIFCNIRNYSDKILLSDESVSFTGAGIFAFIQEIKQNIAIFSQKRSRIGILIPNSTVLAVSILSVLALGRIPVILSPSARREKVESLLPKLNLDFLIVSKAAYPELVSPCSFIHINMSGIMTLIKRNQVTEPHRLAREGTSIILYTSGSEGEPKGVQISEVAINYTIDYFISYFRLNESVVSVCIMPLCHAMGLNTQFLPIFFAGGKSVFFEISMSLGKIYRQIIQSEGTFVKLIPEFLQLCYEEKNRRGLDPVLKVQDIQIAGGHIREDHLRKAMLLFPNAIVHKGYGSTEALCVSMINSGDPKFFCNSEGYILPGQDVKVLDEAGNTLPPDTIGKIYVKGPNVMIGYDNDNNDFPSNDGFLNTGDLGLLTSDNRLFIHGRHDSIFKIMGERISGCEIEDTARAISPYFRDVKCLPLENYGRVRLVLFVELYPVQRENIFAELKTGFRKALLKSLNNKLKMIGDIYFMSNFPRTNNGKICNKTLKDVVNGEKAEYLGNDGGLRFFDCLRNISAGFRGAPIEKRGAD
jgi:acyl-[acyl-carrier-protein]-phospholipid O-acyltransferase / long-chain-fatty-acid--[acyl-carrier-protein] ligase